MACIHSQPPWNSPSGTVIHTPRNNLSKAPKALDSLTHTHTHLPVKVFPYPYTRLSSFSPAPPPLLPTSPPPLVSTPSSPGFSRTVVRKDKTLWVHLHPAEEPISLLGGIFTPLHWDLLTKLGSGLESVCHGPRDTCR